jgi:hypothetical protein
LFGIMLTLTELPTVNEAEAAVVLAEVITMAVAVAAEEPLLPPQPPIAAPTQSKQPQLPVDATRRHALLLERPVGSRSMILGVCL